MTGTAGTLEAPRRAVTGLKLPLIDNIWRVRGEVPIDPGMPAAEAFARIDPLLRIPGTDVSEEGGVLTYTKRNPQAQDKLATFTRGRMWIEQAGAGAVLRFDLFSHALLLCFLAPLLFLGFSQLAITIKAWEAADTEAGAKAEKKDEKKPPAAKTLNPVDEFLGAPAPEDPSKKKKDKKKDAKDKEGRHSPDEGYVLAGIFAAVYLFGRRLEPFLVRRRLRAALAGPPPA
ncbi:hypothetical protein [Porphyrobacter sp. AAP82]|uniref:hypothetical protein n=1 Tax=Porphyrobacter sp. AAP82 TaxID=1248917 RepID=UPI0002D3CAAC|nr:hypothetical protein [Porphyrobacter sp. AAP82]